MMDVDYEIFCFGNGFHKIRSDSTARADVAAAYSDSYACTGPRIARSNVWSSEMMVLEVLLILRMAPTQGERWRFRTVALLLQILVAS